MRSDEDEDSSSRNREDWEEEEKERVVKQRKQREQRRVDSVASMKPGKLLLGRWRIVTKVGEGGCGAVYKVRDTKESDSARSRSTMPSKGKRRPKRLETAEEKGKLWAIKLEAHQVEKDTVLKMEFNVLRAVNRLYELEAEGGGRLQRHFCRLMECGRTSAYSYLIMSLVGPSLSELRRCRLPNERLSLSTTVRVGLQALFALHHLHNAGFVHRDINPSNWTIGWGSGAETRRLYLIDFGLCRRYLVGNESRPPRKLLGFRGTTSYCSPTQHDKVEQCRRDDIWSLMYTLIEINRGLPWSDMRHKRDIIETKRSISDEQLCRGMPGQFVTILQHVRRLGYYDTPDYLLIYNNLTDAMRQNLITRTDRYDWEPMALLPPPRKSVSAPP